VRTLLLVAVAVAGAGAPAPANEYPTFSVEAIKTQFIPGKFATRYSISKKLG